MPCCIAIIPLSMLRSDFNVVLPVIFLLTNCIKNIILLYYLLWVNERLKLFYLLRNKESKDERKIFKT